MNTQLLKQASQLSLDDQLELVEALWDAIAQRGLVPAPSAAQVEELDRRIADLERNPEDVVTWSDVKAEALARLRR